MKGDSEACRQQQLAREIGKAFHQTDKLVPLGPHSSFGLMIRSDPLGLWMEKTLGEIAWQAVALQLQRQGGRSHVIDHAWLAGFKDPPHEAWALISEPYLDAERAERIKEYFDEIADDWSLECEVLPAARSSWNPGQCTPLVFTFWSGHAAAFARKAVTWWLDDHNDQPWIA